MADERVEVAFPFVAADSDQISLILGETIEVVKKLPTGWWIGRDPRGHVGGFPAAYTRPVKAMPKFSVPKENKTAMLQKGNNFNNCNGNDTGSFSGGGVAGGWPSMDARSTGGSSAASSLNTSLQTGGGDSARPGQQQTKNFYSDMSKGDTQQLRQLLGLDDEDDGMAGPSAVSSAASPDQHRQNLEKILATSFENTAGNHRSLRDGRPKRGGSGNYYSTDVFDGNRTSALGPSGAESLKSASGGGHHNNHRHDRSLLSSSSSLVEQVIAMRKEICADAALLAKLAQKESVLEQRMHAEDHNVDDLKHQVVSVKNAVQHHQCLVADLEQRIEVLRAVVEGGSADEVPAYDPTALARQLDALLQTVSGMASTDSTQVTPSSSPRYASPQGDATSAGLPSSHETGGGGDNDASSTIDPPSETSIDNDPVAKKLIRKLLKRIAEADETRASYEKQKAKVAKRINKFKASIKQVDEEIDLLRTTLNPEGDTTTTTASNGATNEEAGGGGGGDDCTSSAAMSDTDDYASLRERSVSTTVSQDGGLSNSARSAEATRDKMFRKLLQTLTDEEQSDIEKYQLAEIKLQQKTAKLKEQVDGDSVEVAGLRARIEKLKRLLGKGDQALQALLTERTELQSNIRTIEGSAVNAAKAHQAAAASLDARRIAVQHAVAKRNAAVAKQQQDREALTLRIAKEHQRCADFEIELAKLMAKANDAAVGAA